MQKIHFYLFYATLVLLPVIGFGQDPHLSQYNKAGVLLNPALTGVFKNGQKRATINFRSQWGILGSKITTTAMAYDLKLDQGFAGGGYILYNDGAGVFNHIDIGLSGSKEITDIRNEKHNMYVGLQAGIIYKSTESLSFDNQYERELGFFNQNIPNGEEINVYRKMNHNLNIGFHYSYKGEASGGRAAKFGRAGSRSMRGRNHDQYEPYGGFALMHVTSPRESFLDSRDKNVLALRKWVFYGGVQINDPNNNFSTTVAMIPHIAFIKQGSSYNVMGVFEIFVEVNNDLDFNAGLGYRYRDAVFPFVEVHYKDLAYRLSYDINVSRLRDFTNSRGAIELSMTLINF